MKALAESLKKELFLSNAKRIIKDIRPVDDRLFWKWIDAMGGVDVIGKESDNVWKKAADLGTTVKQMKLFEDIFFSYAMKIKVVYFNENMDMGFSDDELEYESWGAVWHGKDAVKQFLHDHDNAVKIFDADWGDAEESGYIMNSEKYEEFLEWSEEKIIDLKEFK